MNFTYLSGKMETEYGSIARASDIFANLSSVLGLHRTMYVLLRLSTLFISFIHLSVQPLGTVLLTFHMPDPSITYYASIAG